MCNHISYKSYYKIKLSSNYHDIATTNKLLHKQLNPAKFPKFRSKGKFLQRLYRITFETLLPIQRNVVVLINNFSDFSEQVVVNELLSRR